MPDSFSVFRTITPCRRTVVAYGLLDCQTAAARVGRTSPPAKENTIPRSRGSKSIKVIARQQLEDGAWGIPASPESSLVQRLMNEIQSQTIQEERWLSRYREISRESN
jgi:hypothetical protein